MLVGGVAAAQVPLKGEKKIKIRKEKKITSNLEGKISEAMPEEELPVIIFFKNKEKTAAEKVKAQSAVVSKVKSKGGKVKHIYNLVDAVSAKLLAGKIKEIASSEEIERIYYDEIIPLPPEPEGDSRPAMDVSAPAIGADYAWNTLGYTGTGIKVAVVDTGINYSHPDLGGGFGPGYRVIGGYDFYNERSDPIDDNGHGTHVAGTIGANGSIKGVASNVSLFAVKVCNLGGSCPTSDVIAGIDWSVANGADIISMSLGGSSQPNDEFATPIDVVADAAVDKGVVVVIAAGNEGPGTGTVSHWGSGKKVITVGASDDNGTVTISDDTVASFSSRGPSAFGRLDPELVAPGVYINSTKNTGGYTQMSGTSMATPHVSGAAALLLQKNSNLTPADVRRILMHTASNLTSSNIHVFEKGSGIINVTKALTYNISATINDDDRWEESVLPGFTAIAKLNLTNNNNYPVNFTFDLEGITDLEGDNSLASSTFSLPSSVLVPAMSTASVDINFTTPLNANPAIYGTTLVVSNTTAGTLRIPVVITIPLLESGLIQGTVDDDRYYPGYLDKWGDWIYYKLKSHNGTSLYASLNWTDSNDDLDLNLYAPNGMLVDSSTAGSGTSEQVNLFNMVYDEYWIAVYAWSLSGTGSYNLTVSYPAGTQGNLQVSPSSWQGTLTSNETQNITFTITNDAIAKSNLNLSVKIVIPGGSNFTEGTIGYTGSSYSIKWQAITNSINVNNSKYLNATLLWGNPSNDLDLKLFYYDGSSWLSTRFESRHNNSQLGEAWEKLENIDVQHYLKNYPDFGVGIRNWGSSQTYNLTVNFTDIAPWNAAAVNETMVSLSTGQVKQVNVTINGSALVEGIYDSVFVIQNATEDFATVPIRLSVVDTTPPSITVVNPSPLEKDSQANLTITITELRPDTYKIYKNGSLEMNGSYSNGVPFNISIDTSQAALWNYTIWANDTAGNSNSTSVFIAIQDTTPPAITISFPQNITYNTTSVELNYSVNESTSWEAYSLDEGENLTISPMWSKLRSMLVGNYTDDRFNYYPTSVAVGDVDSSPGNEMVITLAGNLSTNDTLIYSKNGTLLRSMLVGNYTDDRFNYYP
ncbi:MAG: S8 family serine peptidase, partial [Candidatus Hydrothermarchaeales archaeon]